MRILALAVLVLVFVGGFVSLVLAAPGSYGPPLVISSNATLTAAVQDALAHPSAPLNRYALDLNTLRRFYLGRNDAPAWTGGAVENDDAAATLTMLAGADADGLDPAAYHLGAVTSRQKIGTPNALAEADLLLTAAMLSYMHDIRIGRVKPDDIGRDIALPVVTFDAVSELSKALSNGTLPAMVLALEPPHREYAYLKAGLSRYRALQKAGGWPTFDATIVSVTNKNDPRSDMLERRLALEDPTLEGQSATDSAGDFIGAIRHFQSRHGLEATGLIDKKTLAALNVPVSQRIDQIIANMERWRWLPQPFEQAYIEVNTADATLKVVDRGDIVLTSKIVSGKLATPTPIFSATVVAVTVNPYWNIPPSIAKHEILPKERLHPGYMDSQHILADGPGGELRQQPGADNALGFLKLEMPNRFDAYLHDTPARNLFARGDRHFSHGCMRVQQIVPLASWALSGSLDGATDEIEAAIAAGTNQHIPLARSVPVYVLYWTAIADRGGFVEFRPDVYGRDTKLLAALAGKRATGRLSLNINCRDGAAG